MTKEQALSNKNRIQTEGTNAWKKVGIGTLEEATGVGKSKMALDILSFLRTFTSVRALFVVPTEEMRDYDWPEEFSNWHVSKDNVKLICYASLGLENLSSYNFIMYDEGHRLTMEALMSLEQRLMLPDKPYVLALTATVPTKFFSEEEKTRYSLFRLLLPTVHKITTDEAVELGLVKDFEVKVLTFDLDSVTKNIKAGTKAKSWFQTEKASYDYLNKKVTAAIIAKDKLLPGIDSDESIAKADRFLMTQISQRANFIYNLPSKARLAKACYNKMIASSGARVVAFCGSIEQANFLCGDNVYHSKSTRKALDDFQASKSPVIGTVRALNEGKNLTKPTHGLIVQVDGVHKNLVQRVGRLIRMDYDNMQSKALIAILVCKDTKDQDWFERSIADFDSKRISYHHVKVPTYES